MLHRKKYVCSLLTSDWTALDQSCCLAGCLWRFSQHSPLLLSSTTAFKRRGLIFSAMLSIPRWSFKRANRTSAQRGWGSEKGETAEIEIVWWGDGARQESVHSAQNTTTYRDVLPLFPLPDCRLRPPAAGMLQPQLHLMICKPLSPIVEVQ